MSISLKRNYMNEGIAATTTSSSNVDDDNNYNDCVQITFFLQKYPLMYNVIYII